MPAVNKKSLKKWIFFTGLNFLLTAIIYLAGYKVEICGVNTAELPLLKAKEKEELLNKIKQGDANAREQFIKGNLRLVLSIVQRLNQSN